METSFKLIASLALAGVLSFSAVQAETVADSVASPAAVMMIPYNPMMHLSDSDNDIADGSGMNVGEMRQALRADLIKALNKSFAEIHDVKVPARSFVTDANNDIDLIYHSLYYDQQKTFTALFPQKYHRHDTTLYVSKTAKKPEKDEVFIHSGLRDKQLLSDLSEKYGANYFIFLNEIDIKTNYNDCINLALKIYNRDIKVHYSIYDVSGKLVYGDVATVHFPSSTNTVKDISAGTFPEIAKQILNSFNQAK